MSNSSVREDTIARVKADLRISHDKLDQDLNDQISACLADLTMCGIKNPSENDALILNAIKLWSRANYTDDTDKGAAYMARYDALKGSLMMASEYGGAPDAD